MILHLRSNSGSEDAEDGAAGAEAPTCSTSSSSTEVYNFPLGQQGQIDISHENQHLVSLPNDLHMGGANNNYTFNDSPYPHIGDVVNIQGQTIHVTTFNGVERSIQNGSSSDGQVVNTTSSTTAQKVPKTLKYFLKDRSTQLWLAGLLLAIMSVSSLILFLSIYDYDGPSSITPIPPIFGHDDNLGDDIQVIHREEWLARGPLNTTRIEAPLKMVRILHTASENCADYQICATKILGLQGTQVVNLNIPDIAYNFMIGGDGNVYIGRGADVANDDRPDALDLAYVGNFLAPYDKMSDKMEQAGKRLINRLLERGKIASDYVIVAHNQTEKTTSPGENIYKKIVSWPHYSPELYFRD